MRIAFIAKRNNPKVKIVTGSVNKIKIGFTNIFNSPKTNATIIDVEKFATWTPFIKWEISITNTAVISILKSIFIGILNLNEI